MNGLPDTAKLDTCGCCQANLPRASIHNPPGLPATLAPLVPNPLRQKKR